MLPSLALLSLVVIAPASSASTWTAPEASPRKQVIYVDGKPVVLIDGSEAATAVGPARTLDETSPMVIRRALDPASLASADADAWSHGAVVLWAADGARCEAKVASLALYGWYQFVEGDADAFSAREIWERSLGSGGVYLTAELATSDCQGAVMAQLATAPVAMATPRVTSQAWADIARAALPQVDAFQRIQNQFIYESRRYDDQVPPSVAAATLWDDAPLVQEVEVAGRTFLLLSMAREGTCGDFASELLVAWEITQAQGVAHVRLRYAQAGEGAPAFAFADLDDEAIRFEAPREFYAPSDFEGCGC